MGVEGWWMTNCEVEEGLTVSSIFKYHLCCDCGTAEPARSTKLGGRIPLLSYEIGSVLSYRMRCARNPLEKYSSSSSSSS
jgi:hypothetical protein